MVRERMIKHNRTGSHDEKSVILTWQTPGDEKGPIQWQLGRITHHYMAQWWCDMAWWRHDQLVTMELVLLGYKTRRRVGLVVQSLLLSTTHQLPNKPLTSLPNMPIVRKLDLSHSCFSLNFYFPMFLRLFPSMFPLLTYSQSFFSFICRSPETLKTKAEQDFDSIDTGTV